MTLLFPFSYIPLAKNPIFYRRQGAEVTTLIPQTLNSKLGVGVYARASQVFKSYTTMKKEIQRMVHIEASQGSFGVVHAIRNVEFGGMETPVCDKQ